MFSKFQFQNFSAGCMLSRSYPARIPLHTEDGETCDQDVMFTYLVHNYPWRELRKACSPPWKHFPTKLRTKFSLYRDWRIRETGVERGAAGCSTSTRWNSDLMKYKYDIQESFLFFNRFTISFNVICFVR